MTQLYNVSQVISLTGICQSLKNFHLSMKKEVLRGTTSEVRSVVDTIVSKHERNHILRTGEGGFLNQPLENSSSNLNSGVYGGYGPVQ